jgi:hypothetical protein
MGQARSLYGIFVTAGGVNKFTLVWNKELARRTAKSWNGCVYQLKNATSHGSVSWDAPTFRTVADLLFDFQLPQITDFKSLLAYWGADTCASLNRRVYKNTSCGASLSIQLADGEWIHNGDPRWQTLTGLEALACFTVQTIVEGSEATVDSGKIRFPVTINHLENILKEIEEEAARLWSEANEEGDDL